MNVSLKLTGAEVTMLLAALDTAAEEYEIRAECAFMNLDIGKCNTYNSKVKTTLKIKDCIERAIRREEQLC